MQDANQLIKTNCATTTNRFKRNLYVPIYLSRLFLTSFSMSLSSDKAFFFEMMVLVYYIYICIGFYFFIYIALSK